jgi:hypothetical protein
VNHFYIRIVSHGVFPTATAVTLGLEIRGTDNTQETPTYDYDFSLSGEEIDHAILENVMNDYGASGDRFVLLGGGGTAVKA